MNLSSASELRLNKFLTNASGLSTPGQRTPRVSTERLQERGFPVSPFAILAFCVLSIDLTLVLLFHLVYGEKRHKFSREKLLQGNRRTAR